MSRRGPAWADWEDTILIDAYGSAGAQGAQTALAEHGAARSIQAIYARAQHLRLRTRRGPRSTPTTPGAWSTGELSILRDAFPSGGTNAAHRALQNAGYVRSVGSIRVMASRYGIHRRINARPLTQAQQDLLTRISRVSLSGEPYEPPTPADGLVLRGLARRRLATCEGAGLWRVTLRGLLEARAAA